MLICAGSVATDPQPPRTDSPQAHAAAGTTVTPERAGKAQVMVDPVAAPVAEVMVPASVVTSPAAATSPEVTDSGEYRIHTGDRLIISIPYETDTRMEVPVRPDGRITYLFNIELVAAGRTYRELNEALLKELALYYKKPAVTVAAKSFAGNAVYVMGPVLRPGAHTIQNDSRLLEVLSAAGVLNLVPQITGNEDYSSPVRDVVDLKGAYIARGDKILDVNFEELLLKGDMRNNIALQPRDFIFIPSSYLTNFQKRVYVCGSVNSPKVYRYSGDATLVEAVSEAGGPVTNVANWRRCYLIRRDNGTPQIIDYFGIVKGREADLPLKDGDIIYFPERALYYHSKVASTVISEILAPLQAIIDADDMAKEYHQRKWGVNAPIGQ